MSSAKQAVRNAATARSIVSSKRCTRSQCPRNTPLSTKRTRAVSSLGPTQDAAAEQILVPVVKGLKKNGISQTKRHNTVTAAQTGRTTAERPKRTCVLLAAKIKVGSKLQVPSAALDRPDFDQVNIEKGPAGGDDENADDEPRKGKLAKMATKKLVTARTTALKRPNSETDIPSISDDARPRKRTCLDRENAALTRKKSIRNKKCTSVGKPKSSRARKTYRHRQKTKWSSPGHSADRDVDYDQIPPSTAHLTANGRKSPATKIVVTVPIPRALRMIGKNGKITPPEPPVARTKPTAEVPNDKEHASNRQPEQRDPLAQIQCPPTANVLGDDHPIRSYSPSPPSPSHIPVDMVTALPEQPQLVQLAPVALQCLLSHRALSDPLRLLTGTITPEEGQTPSLTLTGLTDQPSASYVGPSTFTRRYLAGPQQPSVQQKKKNADVKFSFVSETIDLTRNTPSPIHSLRSGSPSLGKLPFSHHVSTSSPVVSKDGTSEDTGSGVLDLTVTKYRDFDVPLDSPHFPTTKTSILKRSPTLSPPRTKHKKVTFALSPEEVDEEQLETLEAPVEAIAPATQNETDELEFLELAFESPRCNGSSSSVDSFPCLGPRLTTKPQAILPSPTFYPRVGKAAGPSSLHSSSGLRRNRSRLSEVTLLSRAADPNQKRSVRDVSLSPARVEPMARGNYSAPIMAMLDEVHAIVKSNVQSRFDSITSDVAKLRRQILAQTQADMSALLDEYITAFNSLVKLEAKYATFSKRRVAAFIRARNANMQGLASLRPHIQPHDRTMQERALVIGPLPGAVRRWL